MLISNVNGGCKMNLDLINSRFEAVAVKTQMVSWELLRIVSGLMLVVGHGYGKMFGEKSQPFLGGLDFFGINLGINMLWIAGFIEFYIGLLIIVGLFTRWAALLTAILMVMAYLSAHLAWFPTFNRGELATVYFLVFMVIFAYGPGPWSLDARLFGKK
jgi:putative oxidoreductase